MNKKMNLIKRYKIVFAFVLPVLILMALRTFSRESFKYDAKKWAEPSFDLSNVINAEGLAALEGEKLILYLDKNRPEIGSSISGIHISPDSLLNSNYLKKIRNHKGPVLLYSADPALSARLWMVISQTGCRNLYILASGNNNEVFKSEFRPDTMVVPEL
jgi:hypothetical protein